MVEVSTSVLNIDPKNATRTFYDLEVARTDYFHIDVMDGKFVNNITYEVIKDYASTIRHISNIPLDVHFMTKFVKENVEQYIDLEPNIITFHIEAVKDKKEVMEVINFIKENRAKVGIAIKPNTKLEEIYEYLPYIHLALIMTVEPGQGGQKFIPESIEKIKKLKEYVDNNKLELDIEVDGGINEETAKLARKAGANILVSGSYIVKSSDYKEAIKKLKNF